MIIAQVLRNGCVSPAPASMVWGPEPTEHRGAMNLDNIIKSITETLQKEANVNTVFGQPLELESKKAIPVARIQMTVSGGGGGGSGHEEQETEGAPPKDGSGGGGGGKIDVQVIPVGFIHEGGDGVVFTAIDTTPEGVIGRIEHLIKNVRGGGGSD